MSRLRRMHYFDTSFLVPLILPEATSDAVSRFLDGLRGESLAASHWTQVEFSSLLARQVRMGGLDAAAAREADARFDTMLSGSFVVLLPNGADFNLAREYLGRFEAGLRAGDALHLAIAGNRRATAIYSLDKALLKAGKLLRVPARAGIALT